MANSLPDPPRPEPASYQENDASYQKNGASDQGHAASDPAAPDYEASDPAAPDIVLPPVQPPGAGFIMQLFFIPLIIVAIIVCVWLMFSWLAHMGSTPERLVSDFERLNDATWQKSLTLANMLRDPSNDSLRRDPALARRLGAVLELHLDTGRMDEDHIRFRMYLCRALGEFEVDDGLPALLRAAREERAVEELAVRRAALEAIGLLVDRLGPAAIQDHQELLPVLKQAASDRSDRQDEGDARAKVRSTAAFVLGLLEGEEAREPLVQMLGDPYPLVRYNAAVGLARHGDERAVPQLMEMLDPNNEDLRGLESSESELEWNRTHVTLNALRAASQLVQTNTASDLSALKSAVDQLQKTGIRGAVRVESDDFLRAWSQRPQTSNVP